MASRIPFNVRDEILDAAKSGDTYTAIAKMFGVSLASVSRICIDAGLPKRNPKQKEETSQKETSRKKTSLLFPESKPKKATKCNRLEFLAMKEKAKLKTLMKECIVEVLSDAGVIQ